MYEETNREVNFYHHDKCSSPSGSSALPPAPPYPHLARRESHPSLHAAGVRTARPSHAEPKGSQGLTKTQSTLQKKTNSSTLLLGSQPFSPWLDGLASWFLSRVCSGCTLRGVFLAEYSSCSASPLLQDQPRGQLRREDRTISAGFTNNTAWQL